MTILEETPRVFTDNKTTVNNKKPVSTDEHSFAEKSQNVFDEYKYCSLSNEIWRDNYRFFDEKTRVETWKRIANACSVVEPSDKREKIKEAFFSLLCNDKFIPGGRINANIGAVGRKGVTLHNCFVIHPSDIKLKDCDSIDGIYEMLRGQAQTLKSEGGYGVNASWIRPAGSYIDGIDSRTPGALKFMELWDKSSEIITQGSIKILGSLRKNEKKKIRKGAQMLVLSVWHPDIKDFIVAKQTPGRLTKFNISVGITPGFMEAVENDGYWELKFPETTHPKYKEEWFGDIEDWESKGYQVNVFEKIKARELWDLITKSTYKRNEPGVLFLDLCNKLNPLHYAEKVHTTNPCGEVNMSTGVCLLGSMNLPMFVKVENEQAVFDYKHFARSVKVAIRFLDNINDISGTPLPAYAEAVKKKRRIGLGVMGLGSLHYMLGIRYGSGESKILVREIFKTKAESELLASAYLGAEKGSFPLFDAEKYFTSLWWDRLQISQEVKNKIENIGCMRNSHQSMNAPTGNTAIYARNVSGGIEPVFSGNGYYRWAIVPEARKRTLIEKNLKFPDTSKGEWFETDKFKFAQRGDEEILRATFEGKNYEIDKNRGLVVQSFVEDYGKKFCKTFYNGSLAKLEENGVFVSAGDLSVQEHVNVLEIAAHFTNMSISKTVNLSKDYPYEDFKELYMKAWKSNIKGITTYRDGTMTAVLEEHNSSSDVSNDSFPENHAPKRPKELPCDIYHMQVRGEKWNFFVGLLNGRPYEVFAGRSEHIHLPRSRKSGYIRKNGVYNLYTGEDDNELMIKDLATIFDNSAESAFTRTVSLALRHGVPAQYVVEQIEKGADKENEMFSLAKGLMRVMKNYIKNGTKASMKKCPQCGFDNLAYQEGCITCISCGYSKCG